MKKNELRELIKEEIQNIRQDKYDYNMMIYSKLAKKKLGELHNLMIKHGYDS